jgi:hypothetical protein
MDPLDLFRQAISASTPPTLLDAASEPAEALQLATYISFPTEPPTNITKETATRYTSKADSKDEFYNIGQLWLAWTEKDAGVRDYLMKGQAGGVGYVGIADRRGVVEFLQGESDGGARIVSATAVEGLPNWSKGTKSDWLCRTNTCGCVSYGRGFARSTGINSRSRSFQTCRTNEKAVWSGSRRFGILQAGQSLSGRPRNTDN